MRISYTILEWIHLINGIIWIILLDILGRLAPNPPFDFSRPDPLCSPLSLQGRGLDGIDLSKNFAQEKKGGKTLWITNQN
jgi:hypothetical protein